MPDTDLPKPARGLDHEHLGLDFFYADKSNRAARPVNGLGRSVGIKQLSAYTTKCRYRHFVVENAIRPLALNRKNALFAGHDEGGAAWARIASLVETAKMNRVNPHAYLKATLEAIANGHPASDIDQLLPWAFTPISS